MTLTCNFFSSPGPEHGFNSFPQLRHCHYSASQEAKYTPGTFPGTPWKGLADPRSLRSTYKYTVLTCESTAVSMANQNTSLPATRPETAQRWLLQLTEPVTEGLDPTPEAHRLAGRGARLPALSRWPPGAPASRTPAPPRTWRKQLRSLDHFYDKSAISWNIHFVLKASELTALRVELLIGSSTRKFSQGAC